MGIPSIPPLPSQLYPRMVIPTFELHLPPALNFVPAASSPLSWLPALAHMRTASAVCTRLSSSHCSFPVPSFLPSLCTRLPTHCLKLSRSSQLPLSTSLSFENRPRHVLICFANTCCLLPRPVTPTSLSSTSVSMSPSEIFLRSRH